MRIDSKEKISIAVLNLFVSPLWLANSQLWPLVMGKPLSPNVNHRIIISFGLKGQFYESFCWNHPHCPKPKFKIIWRFTENLSQFNTTLSNKSDAERNTWLEIMDTLSNSKVTILCWLVQVPLNLNHQLHKYYKKHETELLWSYQTKEN